MSGDRSYSSECDGFTVNDLHRIRGLIELAGGRVGLALTRTDNLVAAVHEVVVNAILYAGGKGLITITQSPTGVYVEISDNGPGLPEQLTQRRPVADSIGGRGLWMARRLCRQLIISSSQRGVTVRMFMPVGIACA
jgi:anti-sigma regulatory factor (Ser/Thr protein kinase)